VIHVEPLPSSQLERLFPGDSEMARRMRALDGDRLRSARDLARKSARSRQHLPPLSLSHAALVGPKLIYSL
jgi:hypothetical protein